MHVQIIRTTVHNYTVQQKITKPKTLQMYQQQQKLWRKSNFTIVYFTTITVYLSLCLLYPQSHSYSYSYAFIALFSFPSLALCEHVLAFWSQTQIHSKDKH